MAGVDGDRENWDLLGEYTNKTLRLKADRWGKAVQNEENRSTILNFLDGEAELVRKERERELPPQDCTCLTSES